MKRAITLLLLTVFVSGCAHSKTIDGQDVPPIGLVNQGVSIAGIDKPVSCIQYTIVWGNVIWGAILIETVIAPIYFYGFSMFEPVGKQAGCKA